MKQMRLRYAGACRLCGVSLPAGTVAIYESETKTVRCVECATEPHELGRPDDESVSPDFGLAGSSARREYERRKAKDEEKTGEEMGKVGGRGGGKEGLEVQANSWCDGQLDAE